MLAGRVVAEIQGPWRGCCVEGEGALEQQRSNTRAATTDVDGPAWTPSGMDALLCHPLLLVTCFLCLLQGECECAEPADRSLRDPVGLDVATGFSADISTRQHIAGPPYSLLFVDKHTTALVDQKICKYQVIIKIIHK